MPERTRIVDIERSMGFKWSNGIARQRRSSFHPDLQALLNDIDKLKAHFLDYSTEQIGISNACALVGRDLFEKHGPKIWPGPSVDRSPWLSYAELDNHNGLYPTNLYYKNVTHREGLRKLFNSLLIEKCVHYCSNRRQKSRREEALRREADDSTGDQLETEPHGLSEYANVRSDNWEETPEGHFTTTRSGESEQNDGAETAEMISNDTAFRPLIEAERGEGEETIVVKCNWTSGNECAEPLTDQQLSGKCTNAKGTVLDSANLSTQCRTFSSSSTQTSRKHSRSRSPNGRLTSHKTPKHSAQTTSSIYDGDVRKPHISLPFEPLIELSASFARRASVGCSASTFDDGISLLSQQAKHEMSVQGIMPVRTTINGDDIDTALRKEYGASPDALNLRASMQEQVSEQPTQFFPQHSRIEEEIGSPASPAKSLESQRVVEHGINERTSVAREMPRANAVSQGGASQPSPSRSGATPSHEPLVPIRDHIESSSICQEARHIDIALKCGSKTGDVATTDLDCQSPFMPAVTSPPAIEHGHMSVKDFFYSKTVEPGPEYLDSKFGIKMETTGLAIVKPIASSVVDLTEEIDGGPQEVMVPISASDNTPSGGKFSTVSVQRSSEANGAEQQSTHDFNRNASQRPPMEPARGFERPDSEAKSHKETIVKRPKILNIELLADELNGHKFVCFNTETHVEELFNRVQRRMQRRLEGRQVQALALSLPQHPRDTTSFLVDSDDPDTWKMFLSRVGEMEGDEIGVDGVVEL